MLGAPENSLANVTGFIWLTSKTTEGGNQEVSMPRAWWPWPCPWGAVDIPEEIEPFLRNGGFIHSLPICQSLVPEL